MEYKNTLNLPRTAFPMKAGLPKSEPDLLQAWDQLDIYQRIRQKLSGRQKYILHDGPPYANGNIHIGHALNKSLKDIVVKYKAMQGFDAVYVPGWDCHGLPIEHQLFKELGIDKYQISQIEFRKKAYAYALNYVALQKEEFRRLGVFGDWQKPYLTLAPDYEESIISAFGKLVENGYIYRGLKPVNWCYKCETALAEAEVEYEEHTSPSIFVKFKLDEKAVENEKFQNNSYLVIWTTTPWTLVANLAVAVHPEFSYLYINTDKGNLIIGDEKLFPGVLSRIGVVNYKLIRRIEGKYLEGLIYEHPFISRNGRVVLADYVAPGDGTGLVHTAPGHGNQDYLTGIKYKLDIIMPVDEKGNFDATAPEFKGLNVFDANKLILEKLQTSGVLLFNSLIQHSYPHCWRCKNPLIFRATQQWFLNIEHLGLRDKLLAAVAGDIRWIPPAGRDRIYNMIELRPDWCLSRQRYWGVPIPALVCNDCGEEFLDKGVIEKFAALALRHGSDCWFEAEIKEFLPPGIKCPGCLGTNFTKGKDILDVWFDSGVSAQAVLKKRKNLEFPAALYLEGSDQHRGWFQSSLIPALCIDKKPPFKAVLTHGFVVDALGRKMSKSLGNVISPQDIIKDYGADILRLWVASSDYNEDIRISDEILSRLAEAYRKIRNTARFILSNLYDFDPQAHYLDYQKLKNIDKWILFKLERVLATVSAAYENFQFHKAYKEIYEFSNQDLSMYYLDMIKGRLYTSAADSLQRRAAQTAIYEVLNVLARVMAPILVFTADEIWQHLPKVKKEADIASIHLLDWPKPNALFSQAGLASGGRDINSELKPIIELIPDVAKALEEKRNCGLIGSSFDAKIKLLTNDQNRYNYLTGFKEDLTEIFKVSAVELLQQNGDTASKSVNCPDIAIQVVKAEGNKCLRCWNYSLSVGEDKTHNLICANCRQALGGK